MASRSIRARPPAATRRTTTRPPTTTRRPSPTSPRQSSPTDRLHKAEQNQRAALGPPFLLGGFRAAPVPPIRPAVLSSTRLIRFPREIHGRDGRRSERTAWTEHRARQAPVSAAFYRHAGACRAARAVLGDLRGLCAVHLQPVRR